MRIARLRGTLSRKEDKVPEPIVSNGPWTCPKCGQTLAVQANHGWAMPGGGVIVCATANEKQVAWYKDFKAKERAKAQGAGGA